MSNSIFERESTFQFPSWRAVGRDACEQRQRDALTAELQASFGAEEALPEEKRDLSQRHFTLAQFEHPVFYSSAVASSAGEWLGRASSRQATHRRG